MRGCVLALVALTGCAGVRIPERRLVGGIRGTVVDAESGAAVSGALIMLRAGDGNLSPPAVSNQAGEFVLLPLAEGKHDFVVEHSGYATVSATSIAVTTGYSTTVAVRLRRVESAPAGALDPTTPLEPPILLSGPPLQYPPDLRPQLAGTVRVRCVLTAEGLVKDCVPDQEAPELEPMFRQLEKRRYRPALRNGRAIDVWYTFKIDLQVR